MNVKLLPALLMSALFVACGPTVTFTEPMPPDEKELTAIPLRYRGDYVNKDGSQYLHIDKQKIMREYDYDVRVHRDSMTYWDSLVGDTLWDTFKGRARAVSVDTNGYVSYHVNEEELVFGLDPGQVAKKFKGYLFLNYAWNEKEWTVEQVGLKKGILTISSVSSMEEVEKLNECVEDKSDTVASSYSPTKKQFKEFVKADGFSGGEEYYRMK